MAASTTFYYFIQRPKDAREVASKILGMQLVTHQTGPAGQKVRRLYVEQGLEPLPASTAIQATMCREDLLVEIEAIAMIPSGRQRP